MMNTQRQSIQHRGQHCNVVTAKEFEKGVWEGIRRYKAMLGALDESGSEIVGVDWSGWTLVRPTLRETVLRACTLRNTTIYGGDLSGLHLINCDARGLRIIDASAPGIVFVGCDLEGGDLSLSNVSNGRADRTVLRHCRHIGTDLENFGLNGSTFDEEDV